MFVLCSRGEFESERDRDNVLSQIESVDYNYISTGYDERVGLERYQKFGVCRLPGLLILIGLVGEMST